MSNQTENEHGYRWWLRYVVVPLFGGGGIIALIVALIARPTSTSVVNPTETYIASTATTPSSQDPVITPTIEVTLSGSKVVPVELLPARVFVFDTPIEESTPSTNKLEIITGSQDGLAYKLIYPIPNSSNGAGIYFKFNPLLDMSQYQSISFSITEPSSDVKIELAISGDGENNRILLNDLVTNPEAGIQINGNDYTISLQKNFTNVRLVQFLYFWFAPSTTEEDNIEYTVSNIHFQKP